MGGLLDPFTLNMGRKTALMSMHATCQIINPVEVDGGQEWPSDDAVTVKCMKGNPGRGGTQELSYDGTAPLSRFWVPVGTVVQPGAKVIFSSTTYYIEQLPSVHASELLQPIDCTEVRPPGAAV